MSLSLTIKSLKFDYFAFESLILGILRVVFENLDFDLFMVNFFFYCENVYILGWLIIDEVLLLMEEIDIIFLLKSVI